MCGHNRTVPTSYKLEGVVKERVYAQRISQLTEIWKGVYNDEVVASKILRVTRDDPQIQRAKSVSMSLVVVLTDNIAVLQGGSIDETVQARQHPHH